MSEAAEAPAMPQVQTKGGVVAYLAVDGALKAADFYTKAFAAETAFAHPADEKGRTMHIHLYINGSSVMLGDFYPEHGHAKEAAAAFTMQLIVSDCQAWFDRAVAAGCEALVPPQAMFWGDIWGQVRDPFGFVWAFDQPAA
ncbi:MAG: VOC family protein [Phenylobacterium sp.]|uniref:VOC family protein n=1 Tax=Phenylobacterium sp. TaxID=1871053 RepID=UPI001A30C7B1|nr:VOC family protein [Phenylobacterium sp.]MBJ7409721.1 VOC family protein [Phenylobacterium sp.]